MPDHVQGGTLIVLACNKCGGMAHYGYNMKASGSRKTCSIGGEPVGIECSMCTPDAKSPQKSKSASKK